MLSLKHKNILKHWRLLLVLIVMVAGMGEVKGQVITYPSSDAIDIGGVCIGCSVTDRPKAFDTDISTYSTLNLVVGLGAYVEQSFLFPTVNNNQGCDEIVIVFGSPAALLTANVLGGIKIRTYNGTTSNNDEISIDASLLTLLPGNTTGFVKFKPTAKFTKLSIKLSAGLLGALNNININSVYRLDGQPSLTNISPVSICNGQSINLATLNPLDNNNVTGGTYTWSSVQGGTALPSTTVSPISTAIYWVRYARFGCYDDKSVTVTVKPLPNLTSSLNPSVCSGTNFSYTATSSLGSTSFSWTRAAVTNISNAIGSGNSNQINEILVNTTQLPINVTYIFTLTSNGCPKSTNVIVKVNPKPQAPHIVSQ